MRIEIFNSPAVPPKSFGGEAQTGGQKGKGFILLSNPPHFYPYPTLASVPQTIQDRLCR
jgi:hypothetical protein